MAEVDKLTCRLSSRVVTRMEETSVVGVVFDINMPIAWLNHILRSDAAFGVSDLVLNVLPALAIETGAEWITTATTRVRQECCPIFTATGKELH